MTNPSKKSTRPKWGITNFYSLSTDLIKKNKKLLLLGVAVVVLAGGGSNFNGNSGGGGSDSSDSENIESVMQDIESNDNSFEEFESEFDSDSEQVGLLTEYASDLDNKNTNILNIWNDVFLKGFKEVSVFTYIIFGLEVFAIIITMMIAGYAVSIWSNAALIKGVSMAESQNKWSLAIVSRDVWSRVWSLIWISTVPWLLAYFAFIGVVIIGGIIVVLFKDMTIGVPLGIFIVITFIIISIYFLIRMLITSVFAKRYSVIDDLPGDESWKLGWKTSKGNLSKMIRLSAMNILVGMFLGILIFIPFAGVAGVMFLALSSGGVSMESLSSLSPAKMVGITIPASFVLVLMIAVFSMFSVYWKTFMFAVQHYAFLSLRIDSEGKKLKKGEK